MSKPAYRDTPRDRLWAALDSVGERATYIRVEVIDLRALLWEPCAKGCREKETGKPHVAHTGRCMAPTGRLGVVQCYCTTP
jgi:hypothetical protein